MLFGIQQLRVYGASLVVLIGANALACTASPADNGPDAAGAAAGVSGMSGVWEPGGSGGVAGTSTDPMLGPNSGTGGISDAPVPPGSIPCAVSAIIERRCQGCHGAAPIGGAPVPLVTLSDFQRDYTIQTSAGLTGQSMRMYEIAKIRVNREQGTTPMPQGMELDEGDRATLTSWLIDGAPAGAGCSPDVGIGGEGGAGGSSGSGGTDDDGSERDCTAGSPQVPLEARVGETCWEFAAHGGGGAAATSKFNIVPGETYNQFYYAIPWPEGHVATRFGARFDNVPVLHHWLAFDSNDTPAPGSVSRDVSGTTIGTDARLIGGWAVGGCNVEFPPDMGLEIPNASSGRKIMIQWHHYNSTNAPTEDGSAVQICTVPTEMKLHKGGMTWLGTENLHANGLFGGMPPGVESEFSGTCLNETSEPITIVAVWPHMHELGVHMQSEVLRQAGATELVFDKPFDFNYQVHYNMDPYIVLQPGDRITSTCKFHNTTSAAVAFGQSTKEEMCYQFVFSYPAGALDKAENFSLVGATNTCWGD